MSELIATVIAGLSYGVPLFLVASGLSLIFGTMNILNFAHGALFMIGAMLVVSILGGGQTSMAVFIGAALIAAAIVAGIGGVADQVVFRRLYGSDSVVTLLASYGLFLALEGAAQEIWGTTPRIQMSPDVVSGAVEIAGARVPTYDLFLIGVGLLACTGLWVLLRRTQFGVSVRAVAHDGAMAQILGIRVRRVRLLVFVFGSGLAGLAGALKGPLLSIDPSLSQSVVLESFAVVIIGGLGSMSGALLAAVIIGLTNSFVVSYVPSFSGFGMYIAVAAVLLLQPDGLFSGGRRTSLAGAA